MLESVEVQQWAEYIIDQRIQGKSLKAIASFLRKDGVRIHVAKAAFLKAGFHADYLQMLGERTGTLWVKYRKEEFHAHLSAAMKVAGISDPAMLAERVASHALESVELSWPIGKKQSKVR